MTTLISVHNSNGCLGRCDAKCYNATQPECTCICNGANHGAGLSQATVNTREIIKERVNLARLLPILSKSLTFKSHVNQLELFSCQPPKP